LIVNLKKQYKEVVKERDAALQVVDELKKKYKLTKNNELEIMNKTYLEEIKKLSALYEVSLQQNHELR